MVVTYRPVRPRRMQVVGEQHAHLVAVQHPPAGAVRHRRPHTGRRPGRARPPGPRLLRGQRHSRSMAPGSSGLGKATVGKSGSGSRWSATTAGGGNPARLSRRGTPRRPTPCSGVYATARSFGAEGSTDRRRTLDIGFDHPVVEHGPGGAERHRRQWTDRPDRRLDLRVHRRHDLRPAPAGRPGQRRGTPCTRCPAADCGWRSPSPRLPRPARAPRRPAPGWVGVRVAAARAGRPRWPPGRSPRRTGGAVPGVVPDH